MLVLSYTPFPYSCKQRHQLEAWVDKMWWFVQNCPPKPHPHFFIFAHWSIMRERSMDVYSVSSLAKAIYSLVTRRLTGEQSCLVHAYLFEAIYWALPVGIRLDVTQHLCLQATIFGALSCFIHERLLICEIMFTRWITSKSRATSLASITELQMQN